MSYLVLSEGKITYGYTRYVDTGVGVLTPLGEVDQIRFSSPPTITRSPGKPEYVASGTGLTGIFWLRGSSGVTTEEATLCRSFEEVSIVTTSFSKLG
jgi:hypothetical protein